MSSVPAVLKASRSVEICGRPIRIFDYILPNVGEHVPVLSKAVFTRTEIARPDTAQYRRWATEVKLENLAKQPIFGLTLRAMHESESPSHFYKLYRA